MIEDVRDILYVRCSIPIDAVSNKARILLLCDAANSGIILAAVRSYNNTKLQTKPTSPLTHQQPGSLQQSSQFTQGGQEWKQQEGADSKTFFSSLVDISN